MDGRVTRHESLAQLPSLGFPKPPEHFPVLEAGTLRSGRDVINRALALNVVINTSFGMPTDQARAWLDLYSLSSALTTDERTLLSDIDNGMPPDAKGHQLKVEALWTLIWALHQVETLDFTSYCGENLSSLLPDLRTRETPDALISNASLRSAEEVGQALDLAYCITWGIADANLRNLEPPGDLQQYVYWERRRALEWLVGSEWDAPDFST